MHAKTKLPSVKEFSKAIWWILIAIYTFLLPYFLLVYRAILDKYGKETVGKVPLVFVAIFGLAYIAAVLIRRKEIKYLAYLIPCGIIAYLIMTLEANPNKHIHIPEYIVMAWLLYAALNRDYQGKGIFILIFVCASLLGVVDELEQGLHPSRFYGWSDMLVNSSSAVIGVFTIMGLNKAKAGDWTWTSNLKPYKGLIWLFIFGLAGAALMCVHLFQVQAQEMFWGVFPVWVLVWGLVYLILTPVLVFISWHRQMKSRLAAQDAPVENTSAEAKTTRLWIYPLLTIVYYMFALLAFAAVSGMPFR